MKQTTKAFLNGLIEGMAAPFLAFLPREHKTRIDDWATKPSYRPPSDDWKNIGQDFRKAIERAKAETKSK